MLSIDQHVAHERVLYEKTLAEMERAAPAAQFHAVLKPANQHPRSPTTRKMCGRISFPQR